ncbi:acyl-CoA dehydrogenase family protein [Nocardia sp. NPDC004123]
MFTTIAATSEDLSASSAVAALARDLGSINAARDESGQAWLGIWPHLAKLGLFDATVPLERGGAGAEFRAMAAMLESVGAELVPGPLLSQCVGAFFLGRAAKTPDSVLQEVIRGELVVAIANPGTAPLSSAIVAGRRVVSGHLGAVIGGSEASAVLAPVSVVDGGPAVICLLLPGAEGLVTRILHGIDFGTPVAAVEVAATPVAVLFEETEFDVLADLHVAAAAAVASGIAAQTLEIAAKYAAMRTQFGRPIGAFQGIKHLCSTMYTRAEQTRAAAADAAAAITDGNEERIAAAVAGAIALDAAVDNAKDCIQILGGIGFTWEHDAHLYLRRAVALRKSHGGSAWWCRKTAEHVRSGQRRRPTIDLGSVEEQRAAVRQEIATVATLPAEQQRIALAESGYLAPHWPAPYGRDASAAQQVLINQELEQAGISRPDLIIGWWAVPALLAAGNRAQIARFVPPTLRGEFTWCQLFSEPGAGSDLASLSTRAERVPGGWRLSGQKVWNSFATVADWGICLARTDKSVPKHRGITYFLVDMHSPGIEARPLREITGDSLFNEVFLDDVFVPDDCVVGEVNGGWSLARTTLASERVEMGGDATLEDRIATLMDLAASACDSRTDDYLGHMLAQGISTGLLAHQALTHRIGGGDGGVEAAVRKLVGVRNRQAVAEFQLHLAGEAGMLDGSVTREFLLTRAISIAGGSTQILLSMVAEHALGLPKDW